jgi:hypothetical protein
MVKIIKTLNLIFFRLVENAKEGDCLVFTYSGHGSWKKDKSGDEVDGKDEELVPIDYEVSGDIVDDYINKILVSKVPKGVNLVCIIDACHSNTILDLKYTLDSSLKNGYKIEGKNLETLGNIICISGCQDFDVSSDTVERGKPCGALTFCFLEVLKKHNYKIGICDLLVELQTWMKKHKYEQIPQISVGNLHCISKVFSFNNFV